MPGFFDLTDPDHLTLLGLASGLMQAGAPSRLPVPFGLALGRGLDIGLAAADPRLRGAAALRQQFAPGGHPLLPAGPWGKGPVVP